MLQRASKLEQEHADTWAALAARYYDDGHYGGGGSDGLRRSEAAADKRWRWIRITPRPPCSCSICRSRQRLQDGYDSALKLVAQRPDSGEAHFALSYVLRYGGLLEEAARECEQAVSRDPTNPRFRTCAQPLMQLGRYEARSISCASTPAPNVQGAHAAHLPEDGPARKRPRGHAQMAPEYFRALAPKTSTG